MIVESVDILAIGPRRLGTPNTPMLTTKTMTAPESMAGVESGIVTLRAVRKTPVPQTRADSSRAGSIRFREPIVNRYM